MSILHVCRNNIRGKGKIPDNIETFIDYVFDFVYNIGLFVLKNAAVAHRGGVFGYVLNVIAHFHRIFNGGFVLQNDGNADHVGVQIGRRAAFRIKLFLRRELGGNTVGAYFPEINSAAVVRQGAEGQAVNGYGDCQRYGKYAL